jgi:hypothetical protein
MEDWQDAIKDKKRQDWWGLFGDSYGPPLKRGTPEGVIQFKRRKTRKFRARYIVLRTDKFSRLKITNAEIRYRKSKKWWTIYIDNLPVRSYRTLKAAKLSLLPGVLDRMGAEADRCEVTTSSAMNSASEALGHQN